MLAAASRIYDEKIDAYHYSFIAKSPIQTTHISRILLPRKPKSILVNQQEVFTELNWDQKTKTYLLGFENDPQGVAVAIKW